MTQRPLPSVDLMHPTLLPRPVHHDGWVYEEKVDGYRLVADKAHDQVFDLLQLDERDLRAQAFGYAGSGWSTCPMGRLRCSCPCGGWLTTG